MNTNTDSLLLTPSNRRIIAEENLIDRVRRAVNRRHRWSDVENEIRELVLTLNEAVKTETIHSQVY